MNRIKVLHLHTLPVVSGSGINTYLTMKGTPADSFEVSMACSPGGRLNEIVREAGMHVYEVPNLVQPIHPWRDLLALFEILGILKREKIDLVHTHNSKTGFLGRLAGRLAGTPVVVHTVHGFAFHDSEPRWRQLLFRAMERMAAPWADHTIYISQPLIDWARRERIIAEGRYTKIYSGIDLESFHPYNQEELRELRDELGIKETDRVIGFVSKLWEGKGHDVALQAMVQVVKSFPQARLLLVGEGSLEKKLKTSSHELGLENAVLFTGFRTRIAEMTSLCDLCILPSFFEGMGRVLIEAGACGKPVVASNVGGIPDVVKDGVTGILVPPGDPMSLSEGILRLLQDPELRERMGQAARQRINEKFSARTMVQGIVDVYNDCLSQKVQVFSEEERFRYIEKALNKRKVG